MRIGIEVFLYVFIFSILFLASCVDNAAVNEEEIEQIRQDSIAQADIDNTLIDAYIVDSSNGINEEEVVVLENGVRYIVWAPTVSIRVPEYREIVSVHYTGKFLDNQIFDSTDPVKIKKSDSLNYVAENIAFDDLLEGSDKSYEQILDSLNSSTGAIEYPLFSLARLYIPMTFNHQENGSGISFNFIVGFREGLKAVMIDMELNSSATIMIPSAVAYGTTGTINSDGTVGRIAPNTPLIFDFSLVNIRP